MTWRPSPEDVAFCGLWQSKRDTWVAEDGVRYLDAEQVLVYKAAHQRTKDDIDLANAWPLLVEDRRAWLRETVRAKYPDHPWQARLDG